MTLCLILALLVVVGSCYIAVGLYIRAAREEGLMATVWILIGIYGLIGVLRRNIKQCMRARYTMVFAAVLLQFAFIRTWFVRCKCDSWEQCELLANLARHDALFN